MATSRHERSQHGIRVALIGILASGVLAAVKIIAGVLGNSYALIADGVESLMDVLSSLVVASSLRIAALPPDANHPFGHGRAESLGALVVSMALIATAIGIAIQSVREIVTPHYPPALWTLLVLVVVVVAKETLYRVFRRTGEQIGSRAVQSDAWHHRSDALTSVAAMIGISVALVGGPGYEAADDWSALFVCFVIGWTGFRLMRSAMDDVMDSAPSEEVEERIRAIASAVAGVGAIEKCRARRSGLALFVDIHVQVDGGISVRDGHRIAHAVKDALLATDLHIEDVALHVEPLPGAKPDHSRSS